MLAALTSKRRLGKRWLRGPANYTTGNCRHDAILSASALSSHSSAMRAGASVGTPRTLYTIDVSCMNSTLPLKRMLDAGCGLSGMEGEGGRYRDGAALQQAGAKSTA